jgi:serine/threonine protein kinase
MPVGPVLDIVAEVAGALHVAYHTEGQGGRPLKLLHRDIKPGNIQLTPAGEVKVLDFGVARADFEAREAETRAVRFGSAGYLAPERLTGREGPAADVYSLGVVAVELLSGKRYGQVATTPAAQLAQVSDKLGGLTAPADVRELLGQMLLWDPDARIAARDVERLAARLRAHVSGMGGAELLRDWAEREVPEIARRAAGKPPTPGDLVGQTVTEELLPVSATIPILPSEKPDPSAPTVLTRERSGSEPLPIAEPTAKPPPSTALWVGLAVGFAVVLGLALGVALLAVGAYAGRWSGG